ncbi:hypothetical protein CW745_01865 [Psychromonas sp. psych-6C06]|uniref:hypothetical protein n=1 Tax=Psychromonas sp. psych-6C06 TaxID=2058089 RepID=UPI000C328154|nr:hypothetical protein [Psychromonas sp. psych-6C06]PKF63617.1 hypothetical protein CW745_01865 [Psychromonas sp. psych-6C06]
MAIVNNTGFINKPLHTHQVGKSATNKNVASSNVSEVTPVVKKAKAEQFSMVLSEKQKDTLHQSLGYDQPSPKQLGAVHAYMQVAAQEKRESVMESMSFHFVV